MKESPHFHLQELAQGVFSCVHKPGGGAYSNAGIVDLGDQTLVIDAFDSMAAGRDLRQTAEELMGRPVDILVLTHSHPDHWIGASAFEMTTEFIASKKTRNVCKKRGPALVRSYKKPEEWHAEIEELESQLHKEEDQRVWASLERKLIRYQYTVAEMADYQPRYADQTFTKPITFEGSQRKVELRSMGEGHSEDDAVLLFPEEKIAFIGDIGFFNTQPFLGFTKLESHRNQLDHFLQADYQVLVPGHGRVGSKSDIELQLEYLALMENLIGEVVREGGTEKDALQIDLPEPFDGWLMGGMSRFEVNVKFFYKLLS